MSIREAAKGVIRGEVGIACVALLALAVRWRAMVAVLHADSSGMLQALRQIDIISMCSKIETEIV